MLYVRKLSKAFFGNVVLENISFSVKPNSVTGILGPNGCGKTLLFNIICGFLQKDFGDIIFKNKYLDLHTQKLIKQKITRTFQEPLLFRNLNVYEHLALSIKKDYGFFKNVVRKEPTSLEHKRIMKILTLVKLKHKLYNLPSQLSGGERKLLDIACALVKNFELILLDEPSAGVTPKTKKVLINIIKTLKKQKKTILIVEHDINFLSEIVDEVVVFGIGRVIAKGKLENVKKLPKVMEVYFGK